MPLPKSQENENLFLRRVVVNFSTNCLGIHVKICFQFFCAIMSSYYPLKINLFINLMFLNYQIIFNEIFNLVWISLTIPPPPLFSYLVKFLEIFKEFFIVNLRTRRPRQIPSQLTRRWREMRREGLLF